MRPGSAAGTGPDAGLPPGLARAARAFGARPRVLIALDFDGCLAPIVPDPEDARPLPGAQAALHRLAALPGTTLALVSGRTLETLRRLASPPPAALLVGSHGAEFGGAPDGALVPAARRLLDDVTAALTAISQRYPGATVELKPTASVLHTRRADRAAAAAATAAALAGPASWPGVHVLRGKEVVEVAVTEASKGAALRRLRAVAGPAEGDGGVLYAGDDVTDELAFAVLDDASGDVTVKVGDGESIARHRVPGPPEVACLLAFLAQLRDPDRVRAG
jgi:trehalose-phosphatase